MAHCRTTLFSAAAALLLLLPPPMSTVSAAAPAPVIGMPGCETRCGNMSVPYPYGMGPSYCYLRGFNLTCDRSSNPPRLLLGDRTLQVNEDIDLDYLGLTAVYTGDIKTDSGGRGRLGGNLAGGAFVLSDQLNELILVGCNARATFKNGNITMSSCSTVCPNSYTVLESGMFRAGIGSCRAPIVVNREVEAGGRKLVPIMSYDVEVESFGGNRSNDHQWPARVFVASEGWFEKWSFSHQLSRLDASMEVPIMLDWELIDGYDDNRNQPHSSSFMLRVRPSLSEAGLAMASSFYTWLMCPRDAARRLCKSKHTDCTSRTRGSYLCYCQHGYEGNPYITNGCQDINECELLDFYGCYGQCTNTDGSYQCRCPQGTHGDPYTPGGCYTSVIGNCSTSCGNVSVPYPFGLGPPNCYLRGFKLTCDTSHHPPRLILGSGSLRVMDISIPNNTMRVISADLVLDVHGDVNSITRSFEKMGGDDASYSLSTSNELILMGCNVQARLTGAGNPSILSGCSSFCFPNENGTYDDVVLASISENEDQYCYGIGCCQARISMSRDGMPSHFSIDRIVSCIVGGETPPYSYVIIAEEGWFRKPWVSAHLLQHKSTTTNAPSSQLEVPIVLEWEVLQLQHVSSRPLASVRSKQYLKCPGICMSKNSLCKLRIRGHSCYCSKGYYGNPYLVGGCKGGHKYFKGMSIVIGVASGTGIVVLVFMAFLVSKKLKYRRAQLMKRMFFEKNRGQLLQQLVSQNSDIAERMIISLEELEKATNNFDKARELGGGGHGTVYKGILSDLHVVAIKKPKKVIQKEIDEFINEVSILSQINHRNVVKLYGCCLETEVPMLVYEFISNGTLHDHLHVQGLKSLPWEDRLRIATETAKSVAYLHSTASVPIIHRDIKSVNILLDHTLTAKVADFGASRYVPMDKSGVTTMVQGTIGYMDPMYFYTGRLTEKSDVYGFGVMLVELLTRKKPYSYISSEGDGLAAHFSALFVEGGLLQILDPQVIEEGGKEVEEVGALAVACIKLAGEGRPTMRQVELTLESVKPPKHLDSVVAVKSAINCSWINAERSNKESSRQYSMEQAFEISATYPR